MARAESIPPRPALTRELVRETTRLIIVFTPGRDLRTGGVLSIAWIYQECLRMYDVHGAKVALCAVPGDDPFFLKYSWFSNDNYLLDLNAVLTGCRNLEYLQLHVGIMAVNRVNEWLDSVASSLLRGIPAIHINVLLQHIDFLARQDIAGLQRFGKVTVTTAHDAYTTLAVRREVGVPLHKLGVAIGPELYDRRDYAMKQQILVVSHDNHPARQRIIEMIARTLPRLNIQIVNAMSYEAYKALISSAKWTLTLGEGLDGYFVETFYSGGIAFAIFNDRFFTPEFAQMETVYPSLEHLTERIAHDLQRLDEPFAYARCWRRSYDLLTPLYNTEGFRQNLRAFYRGEYTFP